jgi:DNA repair exonuclease SbcCD ATPase subunit
MSRLDEQLELPIPPPSPVPARRRLEQLQGLRQATQEQHEQRARDLAQIDQYLGIADAVEDALDKLSEELFAGLVRTIEEKLTVALQEVLEQPIVLKVQRQFKRGTATMSFHILREGQPEDIMRGQGGSVANILSVGLRLFALTTLDKAQHRRFLVLDEQDCWLRPDLVPRLVKIVHDAGKALGFQVLMISHHDVSAFERYADKIYRFTPTADGVTVSEAYAAPAAEDTAEPSRL